MRGTWMVAAGTCAVGMALVLGTGCPCQGAACNKPDAGPPPACTPDSDYDPAHARPITVATAQQDRICPALDQDFWTFTNGATDGLAEVTLTTTAPFSAVDTALTVLDTAGVAVGTALDTDGSDGPTSLRLVVPVRANTAYVVSVGDIGGDDTDDATSYTLQVNLLPDPDTHEPNDATAPSTADTTATGNVGYLSTTGDVDAYRFDAAAGDILRFELTVQDAGTVRPVAVLTNAAGTILYTSPMIFPDAAQDGTRTIRSNVALKGAGPFTVVMSDPSGGADFRSTEGRYTLRTELIPDPDEDERALPNRNDTLATPVQIANPTAVATRRSSLSTMADSDAYMVVIDAAAAANGRKVLEVVATLPAGTPLRDFNPSIAVWDQIITTAGTASGNCSIPLGAGANGYLCRKPCATGGACQGSPGGDQQECMPADPDAPNVDRYCAEPRIFRALKVRPDGSVSHTVRYPLRSGRNPVVVTSDQLADSYDERVLTLTFQIVDDLDTHEPDDLPPPLLIVSGGDTDVRSRDLRRFPHPEINASTGYPDLCPTQPGPPDGGIPPGTPGCFTRTATDGGSADLRGQLINCGSYAQTTMEMTGYLSYEGDRDYFKFYAPEGMYALDLEYSYDPPGGRTPVELTMFVYHANDNGDLAGFFPLRGSFVRTQMVDSVNANMNCQFDSQCPNGQECRVRPGQGVCKLSTGEEVSTGCSGDGDCASNARCRPNGPTGGVCRGDCASNLECVNPDAGVTGAVCIERKCFQDEDDNMGTNGTTTFGPSNGDCLFLNQCNERPFYVEVVDNGLNDSDRVTPYRLRLSMSCGCPDGACGAGVCSYIPCQVGN